MKKYTKPELQVENFDVEDVITASSVEPTQALETVGDQFGIPVDFDLVF